MGGCGSTVSAEDEKNRAIEKKQMTAQRTGEDIIKLLLLGAGESGKSTIFKQMKILYGKPYTSEELGNLVPVVHNNVIQNFLLVLENASVLGVDIQNAEAKEAADFVLANVHEDDKLTPELASKLELLWADEDVQKVWNMKSKYQVLDSLSFYCGEGVLARLAAPDYVPNQMEILQARVRTSGIVEEKYLIDGVQFTMFDVGGQRNERKKWIHCFDNVTAVIFVAAINEYDQVLYEDNKTERTAEAIKLFAEICNSQWFARTLMILFLNKSDLFRAKLSEVPFRVEGVRNDDFEGPHAMDDGVDFEDAVQAANAYVLEKFLAVKRDEEKEVYNHVTCATDTKNVEIVFNACKDIILRLNLVESGFLT